MISVWAEEFAIISYQKLVKEPITVNVFTQSNKTCLIASSNKQVIDLGATNHMTGDPNVFSSFQSHKALSPITIADGSTCNSVGYGIVKPTSSITLSSVLSLPMLAFNFISVSKVTKDLNCRNDYCLFCDLITKWVIGKLLA